MVTGADVVKKARELIGYPYVWGGESPSEGGFDCSGMIQYAYKQLGISIPRTTYDQIKIGKKITNKAELQPGDLIFNFDRLGIAQHVVLYAGNDRVIEARYEGTLINEYSYWKWEGVAVRVLNNSQTETQPVLSITGYRVIVGKFSDKKKAEEKKIELKKAGFDSFISVISE